MKFDALKQFAKLKQQLTEEKSQIEDRLNEINSVLGSESPATQSRPVASTQQAPSLRVARPGRKAKGDNTMSLREAVIKALSHGPLARKELVGAVEGVGYVFNTKNPLNSIGSVLYAKNTPVMSKFGKFFVEGSAQGQDHDNNGSEQAAPQKKSKRSPAVRARMAAAAKASWAKRKRAA